MINANGNNTKVFLAGNRNAAELDKEAADWGLDSFALVEAAGRACADALISGFPHFFNNNEDHNGKIKPFIVVIAGSGNNAADALVMLRSLVIKEYTDPHRAFVILTKFPSEQKPNPLVNAIKSVQCLNIPVVEWNEQCAGMLRQTDFIIDGLTGSGLQGSLRGKAAEISEEVGRLQMNGKRPIVASVDIPSGVFDTWQSGMPVIKADATLAIEPQKLCLYTPAARPFAGDIIPVKGIFPQALMEKYHEAVLLDWNRCASSIPAVKETAYKYDRGVVEIRAGSPGAAGAANLAARGAQAAGAGLVRLIVDPSLYPVLAVNSGGIMVVPDFPAGSTDTHDVEAASERFTPDAVLLGPGWGRGEGRKRLLENMLPLEEKGIPLILDADAIALARDFIFHGNAIITPHPGEFAFYTGLGKNDFLSDPIPVLRRVAAEKNVHILFKGHVLYICSPLGKIGIIDGMNPAFATGGTGDVLAGFCAAIAGRMHAEKLKLNRDVESTGAIDCHLCASLAAALLIEAGKSQDVRSNFLDPLELASKAANIAGNSWLPGNIHG